MSAYAERPPQLGSDVQFTLNRRQLSLYTYRCDLWAAERWTDRDTGRVTEDSPRRVAVDIPCLYEYTPNIDDVTDVGRIKRDILDTTDKLHLPISIVASNDFWVVNRTLSPNGDPSAVYGNVHRVVGAPQRLIRFATQIALITEEERPPKWLLELLPTTT